MYASTVQIIKGYDLQKRSMYNTRRSVTMKVMPWPSSLATIKSITLQFDITSTLKTVHLRHDLSNGLKFNSISNSISKTFFIVDELSLPASWPLQHFYRVCFRTKRTNRKSQRNKTTLFFVTNQKRNQNRNRKTKKSEFKSNQNRLTRKRSHSFIAVPKKAVSWTDFLKHPKIWRTKDRFYHFPPILVSISILVEFHSSKLKLFLKLNLIKNRLNLNQNQNGSAKRQKPKECILINLELSDLII